MIKGRKGQYGVGLAIKEKVVNKAGEDGITIECISGRLLDVRISIKSNFVTFVVIYAPTELHRSISARSGIRLRFNRRERQDREERWGRRRSREQNVRRICPRQAQRKRQTTAGLRRRKEARS